MRKLPKETEHQRQKEDWGRRDRKNRAKEETKDNGKVIKGKGVKEERKEEKGKV